MILYGGDYYPEQWKEAKDILQEDLSLMKKAHCNTVTLGVFAWSELEPEEGEYDFSFLDEMIDQIGKNGGNVILATPSGAGRIGLQTNIPKSCVRWRTACAGDSETGTTIATRHPYTGIKSAR